MSLKADDMLSGDVAARGEDPTVGYPGVGFVREFRAPDVAEFEHQRDLTDLDVREFGRHRRSATAMPVVESARRSRIVMGAGAGCALSAACRQR